jgi:MOSC domain-containing protein YiiM
MNKLGDTGIVVSVNVSEKKGTRKKPVAQGVVTLKKDFGVADDAHAGDWHRQVSFLARESIDTALEMGLDVKEGDFGENITTRGLELKTLPIGTQLRIGDTLTEISQIGKACHTRCAIYYLAGDCIFPREGIFGWVLEEGQINEGDTIEIVKWGDGTCKRTPQEALDEIVAFHAQEEADKAAR